MRIGRLWTLSTAVVLATPGFAQSGQRLGLEAYLQEVTQSHDGVRAAQMTAEGAAEKAEEGSLLFSPQLFGQVQASDDKRQPTNPMAGTRTEAHGGSLGVSQQFRFGLQGKLYYQQGKVKIHGVNPAQMPLNDYYDTSWNIEITQPLWKNGFGSSARQQEEAAKAQANAQSYMAEYQKKGLLADAETRYWRLAVAREMVKVSQQTYFWAQKIRDYNARKAKLQLADKADALQAEAALKGRALELENARNEESSAMRAFNVARGIDGDKVTETLDLPSLEKLYSLKVPERAKMRDDVKAAEAQKRAAVAAGEMGKDKFKPQVDLFANMALTGKDPDLSESTSKSTSNDYPNNMVGVRFSMPLAMGTTSAVNRGYQKDIQAAELTLQRKMFEQESDWNELNRRFEESKNKLKMAVDFAAAQKAKLEAERKRQQAGRSTTYQVFLFEQDFLNAEINLLQIKNQILALNSQMKTFRGAL